MSEYHGKPVFFMAVALIFSIVACGTTQNSGQQDTSGPADTVKTDQGVTDTGQDIKDTGRDLSGHDTAKTDNGSTKDTTGCEPGTEACECATGDVCHNGLVCLNGTCATKPDCPAGSDGCVCAAGDECGVTSWGEELKCENGVCKAESCVAGETGCACEDGYKCGTAGDICQDGYCRPKECPAGQKNCACAGGGCAQGLVCRDGRVCVDGTGWIGGPCFSDGTCRRGTRCVDGTCMPCNLGSKACACQDDDSCYPGLACENGLCVDEGTVGPKPPAEKPCYTPCQADLTDADGTFRPCGPDGLMDGCIGGLKCIDGSCVKEMAFVPTCRTDIDCPDFQTCIKGKCYSNCETNDDCDSNRTCHLHVCRVECSLDKKGSCPQSYACLSGDGVHGVCMPVRKPGKDTQKVMPGTFSLSKNVIKFSNTKTIAEFTITNNSNVSREFVIHKRSHARYPSNADPDYEDDPANDGHDCDPAKDCPLYWLEMGANGANNKVQDLKVIVPANGKTAVVTLASAGKANVPRWEGTLEITNAKLGTQTVHMEYVESPDGRWVGQIHYLANFNEDGLADWDATPETRNNSTLLSHVGNALVQRWGAFRTGNLSWNDFLAVLKSTETASWRWASVKKDCPAQQGACYPFDNNSLGLSVYTSDLQSRPIPTGHTELPFAVNLYFPDPVNKPAEMSGLIDTNYSLQYAGKPKITLKLGEDPSKCQVKTPSGLCLVFLNTMDADIYVGGRYITDSTDTECSKATGFKQVKLPWLVPGFTRNTEVEPDSGLRYRYECRDTRLPWGEGVDATPSDEIASLNLSLAPGNPIPDGRTRRRKIELIDGALINQRDLFLLFRETYASFLPDDPEPFSAYGYVLLRREPANLDMKDDNNNGIPNAFDGSSPSDNRTEPAELLNVQCRPELVQQLLGWNHSTVTADNAADVVLGLIDGRVPKGQPKYVTGAKEAVHYLCGDTGLFDGGSQAITPPHTPLSTGNNNKCVFSKESDNFYKDNGVCEDGGPGSKKSICPLGTDKKDCGTRYEEDGDHRVACPAGSNVIFFTVDPSVMSQRDIAGLDCQKNGTCRNTLNKWRNSGGGPLVQYKPAWECSDPNKVFCDSDRMDLRHGKLFYAATDSEAVFPSIYAGIDQAFRYKTKFRSRDGKNIGFVPDICQPDSDQIPYCYDPDAISGLQDRVNCLLSIWQDHYEDGLKPTANKPKREEARNKLNSYLCTNFAYAEACHPGMNSTVPHDGFERLYSELLIMLGDDSYTKAFAARFDLAGSNAVSFKGTLFEPGGINLSGAAGYEMFLLYRAVQYYQEALDRFYSMSPKIWKSVNYGFEARNFITPESVTWYFDRLIRASTQKSRAYSEIAKRYQNLNRPDLSRSVIERAYTATYLEGILLSQLMQRVIMRLKPEDRPQVRQVLEQAQRRYRMAMLDMRNVFDSITDEVSYFGLPPDYIPFPVTFGMEQNAFELMDQRAQQRLNAAKFTEDQAINRNTAFETDKAQFQSQLVQLRNNYENQLAQLCGTFKGADGKVYPAIPRYADLNEKAKNFQDPCGLMGNGAIFQAMGQFEQSKLDLQEIHQNMDNVLEQVKIERNRVSQQCELIAETAEFVYNQGEKQLKLKDAIAEEQLIISGIDRTMGIVSTLAGLTKCSVGTSTDCPTAAVALSTYTVAAIGFNLDAMLAEGAVDLMQHDIEKIDLETARWQTEGQCDVALVDSNATTANLLLQMKTLQIQALKAEHQIKLALGGIRQQINTAKRLEDQQVEAEQMQINVQAAHDDPNTRIYRDNTIVNADIQFKKALQAVYKATRVFEYYSGQSYAETEKLFLIRSIQYGDYNLENYLTDLEDAYYKFEETYGIPSNRVAIISLRDDILRIPRLDENGAAISQTKRIDMMRERLKDPSLIDENGYLRIPFSTDFLELSPVTRVHKINYMESEIIGSNVGDTLGRVYVRQAGTSVIHTLSDERNYYRFPTRLAVVNPFFNGSRVFVPEVYKNLQLKDRPYISTAWELIFNQRDEKVNQDIDLQSLTDIRLYVYYTDFTEY